MKSSIIGALAVAALWAVLLTIAGTTEIPFPDVTTTPSSQSSPCFGMVSGQHRIVDCRTSAAAYVVLGRVDRVTRDFDVSTICASWPTATDMSWEEYSWSEIGVAGSGLGMVLCLAEVKR